MCDCVDRINKSWASDGACLDTIPITDMNTGKVTRVLLYLPAFNKKTQRLFNWRKKCITPTFCPFCGIRLIEEVAEEETHG